MNEKLTHYYEIIKHSYQKHYEAYSEEVKNNFGLTKEQLEQLNNFFDKTNNEVLLNLFKSYEISINGGRKGDSKEFNINVPVLISDTYLMENELNYLKFLYLQKLETFSYRELGFNNIKIIQKNSPYWSVIPENLYFSESSSVRYILSANVSISKMFVKKRSLHK